MKALYRKYERHLTTLAFLVGFIFDAITLQQIDRWFEHLVLLSYLFFASAAVVIFNAFDTERERTSLFGRGAAKFIGLFPLAIQFSFGAILSGSLVFYSRSASLSVSWPFIVLLVALVFFNEIVKDRYARLALQLSSLFATAFLYASFAIPVVLRSVGTMSFVLAGLASLLFIIVVARFVRWISPERFKKGRIGIWTGVLFLYVGFHFLYFANLIPPLPLTLKEIGIYHSVSRNTSGDYTLKYEQAPWFYFREVSPVFNVIHDEEVAYAFSSISAPLGLETGIIHEWFYKTGPSIWVSAGSFPFSMKGGRSGGYRSYSMKTVFPGEWRVEVKTGSGRILGRTSFSVVQGFSSVELSSLLR